MYLKKEYKTMYSKWMNMRKRCYHAYRKDYERYGGRGIKVCDRWIGKNGFKHFLEDMGQPPTPSHTLDRKDNDADYSPENCKWSTRLEQNLNRRVPKNNNTGITGVIFDKQYNKYHAKIYINYKTINLGTYSSIEEAKKARMLGEVKYHGKALK